MVKKNNVSKYILFAFVTCVLDFSVFAQITPTNLQQFISESKNAANDAVRYPSQVNEFYVQMNYQTAWIQKENARNLVLLLNALKQSEGLGLQEKDYQYNYIEAFQKGNIHLLNINDSLQAEFCITDAALHFYNDIAYGNIKPSLGYNGLSYVPGCWNIPGLLADHILKNTLQLLINDLDPPLQEITAMENKIRWFYKIIKDTTFKEVITKSTQLNRNNKTLISKLFQLGIIDSMNMNLPDTIIKHTVKEAQLQFDLPADGILHSNILHELNVPLSVRLQQLNVSVNYYRWLYCLIQNQSAIVVNIPAAYMKVYHSNQVILEMRMIVGKKATHTPTLTSKVDNVILYPYWHVPYKIATKELLPAIKRNPGFINEGNYQVLNASGKILDPYSINWSALSTSYFPYTIRQSTGCDNSLGLIKLDFYNPFGVYLHDTPGKVLFILNKRFFSHGCMRMEKPMELGHLILKNNGIAIDTLTAKGCLLNQSPINVPADEHMPVMVWYNPAGTDSTGRVVFYDDVYGKFDWMKKK